jgi:carbonic anhydrase/acetyltransferase-like protein (isoleucine patch superfamily)
MDFVKRLAEAPRVDPTAFVAPTAAVLGDVEIGPGASVWFHCVLRGDANAIRVGARANIQDLVVMHGDRVAGDHPVIIGEDVTIGHGAVIHGCTLGDRVLVGMGAIILNGARIGDDSIVAAGALVREGAEIPPGSLVAGVPATVRRQVSAGERERIRGTGAAYQEYASHYRALGGDGVRALLYAREGEEE